MNERDPSAGADALEALRPILKSQYHAGLLMLREGIERCTEDLWTSRQHVNACWQLAYHTLYFTLYYLQPDEHDFHPWRGHQAAVQHPDGIAGEDDPESDLPLLPEPYSREQVLEFWSAVDGSVDGAVDALDLASPESGFSWYPLSKLEHQLINLRHLQHGAAQLADRLRAALDVGVGWWGARLA